MNYNPIILEAAGRYLGTEEWPGARHNPVIIGFFEAAGHSEIHDDETSWCAAFVGAICAELGLPNTGRLNARSYLQWGFRVSQSDAIPGDVVVLWRGSPDGWQGHVGFLVRFDGDRVVMRGGNQGDAVSDAAFPISRVLAFRRAAPDAGDGRPALSHGARGPWVRRMQERLAEVGYLPGRADGSFGDRTRAAVLAFQADAGIPATGIMDGETWAALDAAGPRAPRAADVQSLRNDGSRTVTAADHGQALTGLGAAAGALGTVADRTQQAAQAIDGATGLLDKAQGLFLAYWPVLLICVGALLLWHFFGQIKAARVDDAQTGRNIGR